MKTLTAVVVAVALGLCAGVKIEANTQALAISQVTGASYFQVLYR